jgi:SGNH hydrolase-like domain, acetyltransferase AlgX
MASPSSIIGALIGLDLFAHLTFYLMNIGRTGYFLADCVTGYLLTWLIYGQLTTVSRGEVIRRFILTTGSIVVALILAETPAALRIIDYRTVLGSFESESPLTVAGRHADRELLWQHDPYYQYEEAYEGNLGRALCIPPDDSKKVAVRYDHNGFRNREDLKKADIVVIGDSYIESYMTPESRLATTILGELTGKVVANMGHSGYGPGEELVVLRRYGLPLNPSTVIWAFYEGNDFSETDGDDRQSALPTHPAWQDIWYRSLTRNVAARIVHPARKCTPRIDVQEFQATFIDSDNQASPVYFAPHEIQPQPVSASKLRTALVPIAEAAALCREHNIEFMVVFVPDKYRVYYDLSTVRLTSESLYVSAVSDLPAELGRRLAKLGIRYIDLTAGLKAASQKGIATYLPDDTHWTEAGNRQVAETLSRSLPSTVQRITSSITRK